VHNIAIEKQQVQPPTGVRKHVMFAAMTEMLCRHFAAVHDTVLNSFEQDAPLAAE